MIVNPYAKMVCDSNKGDGGIYFYEEYCEWVDRFKDSNRFKIYYSNIDSIDIISGIKKTVTISLKDGGKIHFYLYKAATLKDILCKAIQRINEEPKEYDFTESNDTVSQLERLAKLHESGAINDEEYREAKQKILK